MVKFIQMDENCLNGWIFPRLYSWTHSLLWRNQWSPKHWSTLDLWPASMTTWVACPPCWPTQNWNIFYAKDWPLVYQKKKLEVFFGGGLKLAIPFYKLVTWKVPIALLRIGNLLFLHTVFAHPSTLPRPQAPKNQRKKIPTCSKTCSKKYELVFGLVKRGGGGGLIFQLKTGYSHLKISQGACVKFGKRFMFQGVMWIGFFDWILELIFTCHRKPLIFWDLLLSYGVESGYQGIHLGFYRYRSSKDEKYAK